MNTERLRKSIKRHEGKRLFPYRCPAGKLSIGYGRNLEDVGISAPEAEMLLDTDLHRALIAATVEVPCFGTLDAVRQEALVEMAYQMGGAGLGSFKKMIAALCDGKYVDAAEHALDSVWAQQTPSRALRIAERIRTGHHEVVPLSWDEVP